VRKSKRPGLFRRSGGKRPSKGVKALARLLIEEFGQDVKKDVANTKDYAAYLKGALMGIRMERYIASFTKKSVASA
jgi:hypothetical protein